MLLRELCTNVLKVRVILISSYKVSFKPEKGQEITERHIHLNGLTLEAALQFASNYGTAFPDNTDAQESLFSITNGHPFS